MYEPGGDASLRANGGVRMVDYSHEELLAKWEEFFEEREYRSKILTLADEYPDTRSLDVRFEDLNRYDTDFAIFFLRRPQTTIAAGEEALRSLMPSMEEELQPHLRLKGIPRETRVHIRNLRSKHLGTFIAVEGLVRRASEVRPKIVDASFRCVRCGAVIKEPQEGPAFREPMECYEDQGGCKRSSSATKFVLLGEGSQYLDTQNMEVQEAPEGLRGGEEPRRLHAHADDDMTGMTMPGDRIVLNGVLRSTQRSSRFGKSTLFDIFLDVNSIEVEQVEFEEIQVTEADIEEITREAADPDIFRHIVASIAPSIYGLEVEKEALALQLFGGIAKMMPDGRRIRGDIHILLVGDPGTAKSELLAYMSRLSPRGIYATGKAASAAGLTAAAVREETGDGRWTLEAGALVLADRGLACIDELDKMNPQDRSAIHEAMEQQRISVAKAGITAILQARCAVLGAANPKLGRFDEHKYISEQIDLPPTLLSRFDIIFSLIDRPQSEHDRNLAEHILRGHLVGEILTRQEQGESTTTIEINKERFRPHFEPLFFRKYVAYAKRVFPVMSPEAIEMLKQQYLDVRKQGEVEGASVPITPRQLEAYVRLAEASARARLSPIVSADDAARAVRIVEYWLSRVAGEGGRVDIDIITTGVSHSQREQMIILRDIITELAGEDGVADRRDIMELAVERGIPAEQVQRILDKWRAEGEVYSPFEGKYKLVARL